MRVAGVDVSRVMLTRAQERAQKQLAVDPETGEQERGPEWILADARALPLRGVFDACVLLFNSIGYGTDDDTLAMFRAARAAVRPGGAFVLDCSSRDQLVREAALGRANEAFTVRGVPVKVEHWVEPVEGLQHAVFRYAQDGRPVERHLRHRMYTPSEVLALLRAAGFAEAKVYGGYALEPLTLASLLMVVHAR
jgi:SAM-dependent methyltransferase